MTHEQTPAGPDAVASPTDAEAERIRASAEKIEQESGERQWWDDPRMPWRGKPDKLDLWCYGAFVLTGVYSLATLPLRPLLLKANPYVLTAVSGSSIALIDIGAKLRLGEARFWWLGIVLASLSSIKFDWVFWWAGRRWGRGMLEAVGGRSKWAAKRTATAERLAARFGGIALFLTWFVPFIPSVVVYVAVGSARMRLRWFLLIDLVGAVINRSIYLYLGYRIGEPAKHVVTVINKYSTWTTIGLVVVVIVISAMRGRRQAAGRTSS